MMQFFKQTKLLILILVALCTATSALAQVSTGTILGGVTDPSGATVAGATIVVTNLATNISNTSVTNSDGLFTVPNLPAGHYQVEVSANGFSGQTAADVGLNVGAQQAVNFQLKGGGADQKIVVTGAAPAVDLVSSTVMPVVNEHTIVELPLNGRDWAALANLQPGVSAVRTQSVVSVSNQRANRGVGNQLTVSGARPQM